MPLQALKRQGRFKRWRMSCWVALLLLVFTAGAASAGEGPYLELDTKGHMALIRSIVFTPDGSELISASDDKTIRVWDVGTGRIVRTIRGEIGDGDPGKIYALALSRDARLLAAGGRTGATGQRQPIRLYDLDEGTLVGLFQGHDDAVLSLDFFA
jgi:WD40 repeat protein